ncbi:hypothetical protein RDI58_028954 [Solanum bulbocastanum]|uniref:Uncharacterized protein n=1 Tax=Solanum bulbocastanum TaxID=147425 RepID=A0AAN8SVG0_SOLBU
MTFQFDVFLLEGPHLRRGLHDRNGHVSEDLISIAKGSNGQALAFTKDRSLVRPSRKRSLFRNHVTTRTPES